MDAEPASAVRYLFLVTKGGIFLKIVRQYVWSVDKAVEIRKLIAKKKAGVKSGLLYLNVSGIIQ